MKQLSCEELSRLSDLLLQEHIIEVRGKINTKKRIKEDPRDLEVYFCYVLREAQGRKNVQ